LFWVPADRCAGEPPGRRTARITGVAFYDTEHGQYGAAPQGIELHPVLRIMTRGCRLIR